MMYSLLCAFLWATTGIFVKSVQNIPIALILFSRFVIAGIFIFILDQSRKRPTPLTSHFANKLKLQLRLASLMVLYYLTATYSFIYAPVALATLLMSLSPCVAIIYKAIQREKISFIEISGFLLAFLGVAFYIYPSLNIADNQPRIMLWGCLLAFSAAIFKAINAQLIWNNKAILTNQDLNQVNKYTYVIAIILTSFSLFKIDQHLTFSTLNFSLLLLLGIFATALPSILNNIASSKIDPVANTVIGMLTPLMAGFLAWIFIGEKLTLWSIFSLLISLSGVLLIVLKGNKKLA
ncbi:DMT family transporter [Acinetobacter stercoris]|uniref:EamA-like transporter family protein n=1 Tax=Acinetobacter stercoris TaxID=2126983 RepID=A0A2U3N2J7_9GAMM|nr:DMT family transporter [Acinetobacter stercoris]SPL71910.1 EamA-like transporter family protein [Acinetobacter stercoris]